MDIKLCRIPQSWKNSCGKNISVAVIDTGYSPHKDLEKNIIQKSSIIDGEGWQDLANGHGNMCMGLIAGETTGIAPEAKLVSIRAVQQDGTCTYNNIAQAIYLAGAMRVDIISISVGGEGYTTKLKDAIDFCYDRNIPVVAAAGNDGRDDDINHINYPARFTKTICVGSIDKNKDVSNFSPQGPEIDFVGVGEKVISTYLNNTYKTESGTSYSAPYVAGIIALLLSKHRQGGKENDCQTIADIREHLRTHTIDLGENGKDDLYGYGMIDVDSIMPKKKLTAWEFIVSLWNSIFYF